MTQYNCLSVKLSNSQPIKLKSAIKDATEVSLKLSSNMIVDSTDEIDFPHKLLLTERQVSKLKIFVWHSKIIHQLTQNYQKYLSW